MTKLMTISVKLLNSESFLLLALLILLVLSAVSHTASILTQTPSLTISDGTTALDCSFLGIKRAAVFDAGSATLRCD